MGKYKRRSKKNEPMNKAMAESNEDINIKIGAELATNNNAFDSIINFGSLINPDPVLKAMGRDISVYNDLKWDNRVRSVTNSRKSAVKKMEWMIVGETTPQSEIDFYTDLFSNDLLPGVSEFNIRHIIGEILDAFLFGYKPMEIIWADINGKILPLNLKGKPQDWFTFDSENNLRFLSKDAPYDGVEVPDNKFLVPTVEGTYDNPYGVAALSGCFWPVTFRKNGWQWWTIFVEKYGMPFLHGKVKPGASTKDVDNLLALLDKAVKDACIVTPDDQSVDTIERKTMQGSGDSLHKVYKDEADKEISVVILGHSSGADSTPGKLGGEDNAESRFEDITDDDKTLCEDTFNKLISITHSFNFNTPAPRFSLTVKEKGDKERAERDKMLLESNPNLAFTEQYYSDAYGLAPGKDFTLATGARTDGNKDGTEGGD